MKKLLAFIHKVDMTAEKLEPETYLGATGALHRDEEVTSNEAVDYTAEENGKVRWKIDLM